MSCYGKYFRVECDSENTVSLFKCPNYPAADKYLTCVTLTPF